MIGGEGHTVEIDETLFTRRKHNVGRTVKQQWVFGGSNQITKLGFLVDVPNRSSATLIPLIEQYIALGTLIISDC